MYCPLDAENLTALCEISLLQFLKDPWALDLTVKAGELF